MTSDDKDIRGKRRDAEWIRWRWRDDAPSRDALEEVLTQDVAAEFRRKSAGCAGFKRIVQEEQHQGLRIRKAGCLGQRESAGFDGQAHLRKLGILGKGWEQIAKGTGKQGVLKLRIGVDSTNF